MFSIITSLLQVSTVLRFLKLNALVKRNDANLYTTWRYRDTFKKYSKEREGRMVRDKKTKFQETFRSVLTISY